MKRIIVIVLLLMLVGGGGAGALIMLGVLPNPFNPPTAAQSAAASAAAKAEAARRVFKPPQEALTFVKLRDMIIPVVSPTKVEHTVYLSVRLNVVKSQKDAVESQIVRYENAVLAELLPYFQKYFAEHDLIDLDEVKSKLNEMAKRLYGDKVIDVLLVNVFEQKFGTL